MTIMRITSLRVAAAALATIPLLSGSRVGPTPADQFAGLAKAYLGMSLPSDWEGIEKLPGTKWAPLPPTSLKNCLPNGDCFARQGSATIGDRNMTVVATGARTMVFHLLLRNMSTPLGEAAVVAALEQAGMTAELVRCPIKTGTGGTNWYRLKGAGLTTGQLSIQPAVTGRPNEGFVLAQGDELPALQPNQLALYTEQCAAGAERTPVSTSKPHEQLAEALVALLAPVSGPALYDWKALTTRSTGIQWIGDAPKPTDLSFKNDPNPVALTGDAAYAGRKFSAMASGTPTQVRNVYLEEMGSHPKGEHMLGVVYEKGITVKLVRCGPVYTESTNNWYSLTSTRTRPAMVRQSIHYDGNSVSDNYELRLDGTLPPRDPRDRNPGSNGC
jgi:hypothetical protein